MGTVREYKFRTLVARVPPGGDSAVRAYLSGTRTHCVIEPCHRSYFPAVISCDDRPPPQRGLTVVVRIALADSEAQALFPVGQRVTIWADAIVGYTICGDGLVGYGVISGQESSPAPGVGDHGAHRTTAVAAAPRLAGEDARRPPGRGEAVPQPRLCTGASPAGRLR
jgi:hypothetical protein